MRDTVIRLWFGLGSDRYAKLAALAIGLVSYVYLYLTYAGVPGNNPIHPLGWVEWADQGAYLAAAKDFAAGSLTASKQAYPPLYPLISALFYPLFGLDLFLIPDLLLLLAYLWLFMHLFSRYVGPRLALFALLIGYFQHKTLLPLQWVTPWTSSLSAVLIMAALVLCDRYLRLRDDPAWTPKSQLINAGTVALLIGLLGATRPGDFLAMSVVLAFYGLSVLWLGFKNTGLARINAVKVVLLGGVISILPLMIYLIFNLVLFGEVFSGYFNSVNRDGGGTASTLLFDHFYGHLINSETLFGEAGADWVSRLPIAYVTLCVVPFGMFFGPPLIRLISLTILVHMVLTYSYADAVPTGQFRYSNIHYMKWLLPILPVIFLYFVRHAILGHGKLARRSKYVLLGGAAMLLLTQAITPIFQKHVPDEVEIQSATSMVLRFAKPEAIDYVDIPGLHRPIGRFLIRAQKISINGGEELLQRRDFRLTPTEYGMRFLFMRTMTVRSVEIQVHGIGDLSPEIHRDAIGVRVHYGLSFPWLTKKQSNPLPGPPSPVVNRRYLVGPDGDASFYLEHGWSGREPWGRWMDGDDATMRFVLPHRASGGLRIRLEGQGFVIPEQQPEIIVDVLLNGVKLGEMRLTDGAARTFEFSAQEAVIGSDGEVRLEFASYSTLSPVEGGISENDARQLSFGLIAFEILCYQC